MEVTHLQRVGLRWGARGTVITEAGLCTHWGKPRKVRHFLREVREGQMERSQVRTEGRSSTPAQTWLDREEGN